MLDLADAAGKPPLLLCKFGGSLQRDPANISRLEAALAQDAVEFAGRMQLVEHRGELLPLQQDALNPLGRRKRHVLLVDGPCSRQPEPLDDEHVLEQRVCNRGVRAPLRV